MPLLFLFFSLLLFCLLLFRWLNCLLSGASTSVSGKKKRQTDNTRLESIATKYISLRKKKSINIYHKRAHTHRKHVKTFATLCVWLNEKEVWKKSLAKSKLNEQKCKTPIKFGQNYFSSVDSLIASPPSKIEPKTHSFHKSIDNEMKI